MKSYPLNSLTQAILGAAAVTPVTSTPTVPATSGMSAFTSSIPTTTVTPAPTPAYVPTPTYVPHESAVVAHKKEPNQATSWAAGIVGAFAGYFLFRGKGHPVLGGFGGFSVANNIANLVQGGKPEFAVLGLASTAIGVQSSLKWHKHPAWGYVLGRMGPLLAGSVILNSMEKKA